MTTMRASAAVAALALAAACASAPNAPEDAVVTIEGEAAASGAEPEPRSEPRQGDQDNEAREDEQIVDTKSADPDDSVEEPEPGNPVEVVPGEAIESAGPISTDIEGVAVSFELTEAPDETLWPQTPSERQPVLMMLFDGAAVLLFTVTEAFDDTDGEPVRDWTPDDLREVFERTVSFEIDGPTDVDHDQFDDAFTAWAVSVDGNPFERRDSLPAMLVAATEDEFTLTMAQAPGSWLSYWLAAIDGQWVAVVADEEAAEIGEALFTSLRADD